MHLCKRLLNFWTWVYSIPWRHPLMQVLIILCDSLSRRDIFGGKWSTFVQYFYTSIVQNYATWYFSFLIFINPARVLHATILGKTTAAARPVLPIDTSMCSISVCPKNGIAACCLGFVGDTPILIHAIKLLCTISDNPWKQNSSSCRQADIEKTHTELSKNHCLQKSPPGGVWGGGGVSIPGPLTILIVTYIDLTATRNQGGRLSTRRKVFFER